MASIKRTHGNQITVNGRLTKSGFKPPRPLYTHILISPGKDKQSTRGPWNFIQIEKLYSWRILYMHKLIVYRQRGTMNQEIENPARLDDYRYRIRKDFRTRIKT
jgi:hypothetical protein